MVSIPIYTMENLFWVSQIFGNLQYSFFWHAEIAFLTQTSKPNWYTHFKSHT